MPSEMVNAHRINHRAAEKYVCERIKLGLPVAPEDLGYLVGRVEELRRQLDDERDASEAELALRHEAMQLAADERLDDEMRFAP